MIISFLSLQTCVWIKHWAFRSLWHHRQLWSFLSNLVCWSSRCWHSLSLNLHLIKLLKTFFKFVQILAILISQVLFVKYLVGDITFWLFKNTQQLFNLINFLLFSINVFTYLIQFASYGIILMSLIIFASLEFELALFLLVIVFVLDQLFLMGDKSIITFDISITKVFLTDTNEILNETILFLHLIEFHIKSSKHFPLLVDVILNKLILKCHLELLNFFKRISFVCFVIRISFDLFILHS